MIWRDRDTDNPDTFNPHNFTAPELITPSALVDNGIKVHLGYPGGKNVGNWSEGSQVFSNADSLNEFFGYCEKHKEKYGKQIAHVFFVVFLSNVWNRNFVSNIQNDWLKYTSNT